MTDSDAELKDNALLQRRVMAYAVRRDHGPAMRRDLAHIASILLESGIADGEHFIAHHEVELVVAAREGEADVHPDRENLTGCRRLSDLGKARLCRVWI